MPARSYSDNRPAISVGLPVYNGARFLAEAIESLLKQSFSDLELIISDNASNDRTPEICVEYARRDPRIRYIRQPHNIGAPRNWSFVVTVARGRFFKWASGNDVCASDMLEQCLAALSSQPHAVLCYGRTCLVDEESGHKELYDGDFSIEDERPSDRFTHLLKAIRLNNAQSGLIRLDALRQTGLDRPYPAGDYPLMAELALRGTFVLLPDVLLYRRMGRRTFSGNLAGQAHTSFYGRRSTELVSSLRRNFDHAVSIVRAPIEMREKWRAIAFLTRYVYWDVHGAWRAVRSSAQN